MAHQLIRLTNSNVKLLCFLILIVHFLLMLELEENSLSVDCTKIVYHRSCRGYGMK